MKYGDYWVSYCSDLGIERYNESTDQTEICKGFFCEVYDDPEYENRVDYFCLAVGYEINDTSDDELDRGIREYLGCLEEQEQETEKESNEILLAEDAVETTAYLANAPDCCSGDEQLGHVLGMLGANVMDEDIYHSEDQHPKMSM